MELFFGFVITVIAAFFDPIRWLVCGIAGWFSSNLLIALIVGTVAVETVTLILAKYAHYNISSQIIFSQIVASTIIIYLFYILKSKKEKKN